MVNSALLWGFLGAVAYAAPQFSARVYAGGKFFPMFLDFMVALAVGTIVAGAGLPWAVAWTTRAETAEETRALSAMLGFLANPAAPWLIRVAKTRFFKETDQ